MTEPNSNEARDFVQSVQAAIERVGVLKREVRELGEEAAKALESLARLGKGEGVEVESVEEVRRPEGVEVEFAEPMKKVPSLSEAVEMAVRGELTPANPIEFREGSPQRVVEIELGPEAKEDVEEIKSMLEEIRSALIQGAPLG